MASLPVFLPVIGLVVLAGFYSRPFVCRNGLSRGSVRGDGLRSGSCRQFDWIGRKADSARGASMV